MTAPSSSLTPITHCIVVPGTLIDIAGVGVLLSGESGSGKSDAVLGLLDRSHRLIADDAVELYLNEGRLHGRCPAALRGLVAVRGLGVMDVRQLFGPQCLRSNQPIDLEITLQLRQPAADTLMVERDIRSIMGIAVPRLRLPALGGRDLPLLLELAAKAYAPTSSAALSREQPAAPTQLQTGEKEDT